MAETDGTLPKQYATWKPIQEKRSLAEEDDEDEEAAVMAQQNQSKLMQTEFKLCLVCQQQPNKAGQCACASDDQPHVVTLYLRENVEKPKSARTLPRPKPIDHMKECARCHSTSLKKSEVVTEVSMGDLSPLVNLTERLYRALPESTREDIREKPGGGRKLLSFYDSRQRAARFAAYVQDVVNQKGYRSIIYEALTNSELRYWPDFEDLTERMLALALQHRLLHNDVTVEEKKLPQELHKLSESQRKRLKEKMSAYLAAEISTQLRSRIALESLGLLAVTYFEPAREPDWTSLGQQIGLEAMETRTLVHYLLDGLRRAKIITLPNGVPRDHQLFGRNKFSPRLVISDRVHDYQVLWCGVTPRHGRRRLVEKVLREKGLPCDDTAVVETLHHIFNWIVRETALFDTSNPVEGYQLRHDILHFHTTATWYRCTECQRLNCRGDHLPCPYPNCSGSYEQVSVVVEGDEVSRRNFYYETLRHAPLPMRIEEHTAQLEPKKGRDYQTKFKSGDINMLSCSTTFEMGIDLGDLQAVVMSNIPPTVANYKQRAGRAGRRTSGTAFILVWAADRPHDQAYFKNPAEIINGRVRIPYLAVDNPIITERHINALLLSAFLRYCAAQGDYEDSVQTFFEGQDEAPSYLERIPDWIAAQENFLSTEIRRYTAVSQTSLNPDKQLDRFHEDLKDKGLAFYNKRVNYYTEEWQRIHATMQPGQSNNNEQDLRRLNSLLQRLREEKIIEFLSNRGILPSYSFPLNVVELRLPWDKPETEGLRLQRDLTQAIREYAPGQEIVANKRIWKSVGLDLMGKEPKTHAYHLCPTCRHLQLETIAGRALTTLGKPCPVCGKTPDPRQSRATVYLEPDGFFASRDGGKPAGQFVEQPPQQLQSALVVPHPVNKQEISQMLSAGYNRQGSLLYINEGDVLYHGRGFNICPKCGRHIIDLTKPCPICKTKVPRDNQRYMLGFKQETDTLHLQFHNTPYKPSDPNFNSFWWSLTYALIQGASHALQIERKDIGAVLHPEKEGNSWRPTVVLYDNVPGGAGHVRRIQDEMADVVTSALEILDCTCEKSCYRCLREYSNQFEHALLDRHPVQAFLHILHTDLHQSQS